MLPQKLPLRDTLDWNKNKTGNVIIIVQHLTVGITSLYMYKWQKDYILKNFPYTLYTWLSVQV